MKKLTIPEVTNDIRKITSEHPGLIKAIGIFGSLARGDEHDGSDIDLIVEYNSLQEFSMEPFTKSLSPLPQPSKKSLSCSLFRRKFKIAKIALDENSGLRPNRRFFS